MQDIIPPRKSIRDIPLPEGRQKISDIQPTSQQIPPTSSPPAPTPPPPRQPPVTPSYTNPIMEKRPGKTVWAIGIAVLLGVALAIFFLYSKATLAIVTKSQAIPVDITASSTKDGVAGTLPYSIITLEKEGTVELNGTVSNTQVQKKATGTITIYNNYSTASQDLVATTRFKSPAGLIYRIDKDITVPGQTTVNGQTTPGSIDAVVTADQGGPTYNVGITTFTIPGFEGTAKANGFYAKSKTAISGGYSGNETTVSDDEMRQKTTDLQNTIQQQLIAQAQTETPDTFVFFPTGLTVNFTTSVTNENGKAVLTGKGVALAPIFNKKILTDEIDAANNVKFAVLEGWEALQAEIGNANGLVSGDFPTLTLHLTGTLNIGQDINIGELQRALAGKAKSDVTNILSSYSSVQSANATIQPFWKSHFPTDASKIHITLTKSQ